MNEHLANRAPVQAQPEEDWDIEIAAEQTVDIQEPPQIKQAIENAPIAPGELEVQMQPIQPEAAINMDPTPDPSANDTQPGVNEGQQPNGPPMAELAAILIQVGNLIQNAVAVISPPK